MRPEISPRFRTAALSLFFLFTTAVIYPQDTLYGSFWCEYRPIVAGLEYPQTDEEAARQVLEEARYIFSGMIYGFSFRYTPSDRARKVSEIFELEPVHSIPWGDDNLKIITGTVDREYYRSEILYLLRDFQARRVEYWESNSFASATGTGSGDLFMGREGKYDAIREGVKEAVRNYLRPRFLNKPREITGEAVLADVPYIIIDAGGYHAKVRVKIDLRDILPYPVY